MKKKEYRAVIESEEESLPVEVLQRHIKQISESTQKMLEGGLKKETIILLIHDHTKIARGKVEQVLDSMASLKEKYCK